MLHPQPRGAAVLQIHGLQGKDFQVLPQPSTPPPHSPRPYFPQAQLGGAGKGSHSQRGWEWGGLEYGRVMTNPRSFNDQPRGSSKCPLSICLPMFHLWVSKSSHRRDTPKVVASTFPYTSAGNTCYSFFPRNRCVWIVGEGSIISNSNPFIG